MLSTTTLLLAALLGMALAAMAASGGAAVGAAAAAAAGGGGEGGKSFSDAAGEAYDAATADADDDAGDDAGQAGKGGQGAGAGDGDGAAAAAPDGAPAGKDRPAPAAAAAGQGQAYTPEQLQQYQVQLTAYHEQLQRIVTDPLFQEAYQAAQAKRGGQTGQGALDKSSPGASKADPPAPAKKPWEGFNPETDNEKMLVGFLDQMQSQFDQRLQQLQQGYDERLKKAEEQLGTVNSRSETVLNEKAQQAIDAAMGELKKEFPDLVDGGQKQKELEEEAGSQLMAAAQRGQRMTIADALKRAARVIGWDGHAERIRQQLQKWAGASAAARVDAPGGHDADLEPGAGIEKRLGKAYDDAAGG